MKRNGWRPVDVASRLELSEETIRRWTRGGPSPDDVAFARYIRRLGMDPTEYGLPPAAKDPEGTQLDRIEAMLAGLIKFHQSGGTNLDHLEGL